MAAKKKTARKVAKVHSPARRTRAQQAAEAVRDTWHSALAALSEAEADVEKQVKHLLKTNRIDAKDAGTLVKSLNAALDRGRHNAMKELEARVADIQERIAEERHALGKAVGERVQTTLATFNIPSRKEVAELTHKVDALSRKIDGLRRR
jgi:poly(hydroxyalkanoate) granule-associated protein